MLKKLYAKFPFLTSHYAIERFGVSITTLLVCMTIICSSILVKHSHEVNNMVGSNVQYTTAGTTSKTGHEFNVTGVYSDSVGKQCFILLYFQDMSTMSRNASDYQMFLTGSSYDMKKKDLLCNPQGSIYVFGSSGFIGLYLNDEAGFQSQILKLTLRCKSELADANVDIEKYADESYINFDQADIYFNPGAADKDVKQFLEDGNMDVRDMYYQTVVSYNEADERAVLNELLSGMETELALIDEYKARLDDDEIVWSANESAFIKGDAVTYDEETENYKFNTSHVCAAGVDFNWQDGTVYDGYLSKLTSSTYTSFCKQKESETEQVPAYGKCVWYMNDGSEFDYNSYTLSSSDKGIKADIDSLIGAWQSYYQSKVVYEQELFNLLNLENGLNEDWKKYTVTTTLDDETLLRLY